MKKENLISTVWPFKMDEVHPYAFWENALTKEECEKIIKISKEDKLKRAKVRNEIENQKFNIRDSHISWIYPQDDRLASIFQKISGYVNNLNDRFFKFDLYGLIEGFQFTNYKAPGGHYGCHVDTSHTRYIRKLSIVIQLTDPKKYKGGELKLYFDDKGTIINNSQGFLCLFPSYVLHKVEPVTKGERNSLVGWVTGPNFK